MTELVDKLERLLGRRNVHISEEMKNHTTLRVGGPADVLVTPALEDVTDVIRLLESEKVPYYIVGNGSNLLVSDEGYRGVIIELGKNASKIYARKDTASPTNEVRILEAEAGAMLSQIATSALSISLTGFEFAAGIPGTIGGAVTMNAGAYGGEIKDVLISAKVYDIKNDEIIEMTAEQLEMGYRTSLISKGGYVVLQARIGLQKGDSQAIKETMNELRNRRIEKQPLEFPSAGSTFKRPEGYFAGKLIEDAELRGHTVGGAQVSEKHCGFVINKGYATAEDVHQVIKDVQTVVKGRFGVDLEPEVKMIGNF